MKFIKMESLGNDYIIIDNTKNDKEKLIENKNKLIKLSNRNFGIGANGIIFIEKDLMGYKAKIFNSDGTSVKTSGNGIICVARYLYDKKLVKENFDVNIDDKFYNIHINFLSDEVTVNMGKPNLNSKLIPVITEKNIFVNEKIKVLGKNYIVSAITVGNPHIVVRTKNIDLLDIDKLGLSFQQHYKFPYKVNIVFEEIINKKIKIRTYEKGNLETKSCGSAACAAVVSATINNDISKNCETLVEQLGGNLKVTYKNNEDIILKGNCKKVYKGKILVK